MSTAYGPGGGNLVRDLATTTSVPEEQVRKLLQQMGLDVGLEALQGRGGRQNDGRLVAGDVKVALRTGRTFLTV